ncbi:MAG: bifunctional ornithine acetyltransferase/N-acetylglutamate synthase [Akkermansiaceae bacterium]|nr:bifunctional ornithine acetyltransferase/N-acetylglutamate synthase [Akkermansiaceae bacterium]
MESPLIAVSQVPVRDELPVGVSEQHVLPEIAEDVREGRESADVRVEVDLAAALRVAAADRDRLTIKLGDLVLAENGWRAPTYDEGKAAAYMKGEELLIHVDLGLGRGKRTVWTCDLTNRYIEINADYRS